jgi:PEP-CTERM motif
MRKLLTLLASVTLLAAPAVMHADTITGQFQTQGMLLDTGSTLVLASGAVSPGTQTGSFISLLGDGQAIFATNPVISYTSFVPGSDTLIAPSLEGVIESFSETAPGVFSGIILLSASGFDDTTANFVLTASEDKGGVVPYTSITTIPPSVPEPSTLALLGTGILGLAGVVRSKLFRA